MVVVMAGAGILRPEDWDDDDEGQDVRDDDRRDAGKRVFVLVLPLYNGTARFFDIDNIGIYLLLIIIHTHTHTHNYIYIYYVNNKK